LSGLSAVTRNLGEAIDCRLPAEIIHDDVAAKNLFMGSKLAKAYVELLDNYLQQRFKPKSSIAIARKLKAKLEKSIAVINNTDLEMTDRIYALQDMQNAFNAAITHRVGNQVNQLKQHSFFSRLVDFIAGNRTSLKTILNNFVMQRPQPSLKDPKLMVLVSHQDFLRNASRRIANLRRKINLEWNNQTSLKQHLSHLQKKIADRILPVTAAGLKAKEQNDKKGREHIEDIFIQLDQLEKGRPPIRVNSIAYEVKFVRPATALLSANGMWAGTAKGALSTVNEEVKDEKAEASLSQSASLRMTNG
jgi:septal ring factor EnvC (AmiA/AmiB activator)